MLDKSNEYTWLTTASLVLIAMVAAAAALSYMQAIMIPFVLAVLIVSLVSPILDFQVIRLRFPRPLAVIISILIVLIIIAVICVLMIDAIQTVITTAGKYSSSFVNLAERISLKFEERGIQIAQFGILQELPKKIPNLVTNTFGTLIGFFSSVFLVAIFVIFLLAGRNPHTIRSGVSADIDHKIRRYFGTKIFASTVTGVLVWAVLAGFGLELAGLFGIFAFLLNFIPSIGSVIATLLPIPIAVAQFNSPWMVVLVILVPGMIQMTIGNFIEPKLMGKGLNLHPITVLLALSFWGVLWGAVGMFLAAPVTAIIRIVLMQFDMLKPIGNLLGGQVPNLEQMLKGSKGQ